MSVVIEGEEIHTECSSAPDSGTRRERFTLQMVIQNSERIRRGDPDFPAHYCPAEARVFSTSLGEGEGSIGPFSFSSHWCGLPRGNPPRRTVWALRDVFHTERGDLIADEIFPVVEQPEGHPQKFTGEFTVVDGTGHYAGVRGHALAAATQLDGGTSGRTAVAACGWIQRNE